MPVIAHPVHEQVRHGPGSRYGCWGKPRPVANAPVRGAACYGSQEWPYRNSPECRYDRSLTDDWCAGCPHQGSGEAYAAAVIAAAMEGENK